MAAGVTTRKCEEGLGTVYDMPQGCQTVTAGYHVSTGSPVSNLRAVLPYYVSESNFKVMESMER